MTPEEIDQLAEAIVTKLNEKIEEEKSIPLNKDNFDHWDEPTRLSPEEAQAAVERVRENVHKHHEERKARNQVRASEDPDI